MPFTWPMHTSNPLYSYLLTPHSQNLALLSHVQHSDPIPVTLFQSYCTRSHSISEISNDSVPPLSPSEFPVSATSVNIQTPLFSSSRIPLSPVSPSSPILSYFYGSPTKSPFSPTSFSNTTDEGWYECLTKHSCLISILKMKSPRTRLLSQPVFMAGA